MLRPLHRCLSAEVRDVSNLKGYETTWWRKWGDLRRLINRAGELVVALDGVTEVQTH